MTREQADQIIEAVNRLFRDELRDSPVSRETTAWNRIQDQRDILIAFIDGRVTPSEGA